MKIGIDARVLDKGMTGTGRYLYNLLKEIPKVDNFNEYFVFSSKDLEIDKTFYNHIISQTSFLPFKLYSPLWLYKTLPNLLHFYDINILFSPNILLPLKKRGKIKYVTVIHDIFPFTYKEYYSRSYRAYLSFFLPKSIELADEIITVSEYSRNEISKVFNIPSNKINVVYNCVSQSFELKENSPLFSSATFESLNLPDKYLLFVGTVEKRKNIIGLIKIMDKLRDEGSSFKLIIVGRPDFGFKEVKEELIKRKDYIKCINFVDDNTLYSIYKRAFAFISPSFYEGFGIPLLEAMKLGLPVLSSNTSSIPEVIGKGGLLHNPEDYSEFAKDIQRLENDSEFYTYMKEKALKQSEKFKIRSEATKLINIFNLLH